MESYRFIIHGKVQHVYYRKFISQALQRLGVQGYVRNREDGTVEVVARVYDDQYDEVIAALEAGSPMSEVERVDVETLEEDDLLYDGFEIRY